MISERQQRIAANEELDSGLAQLLYGEEAWLNGETWYIEGHYDEWPETRPFRPSSCLECALMVLQRVLAAYDGPWMLRKLKRDGYTFTLWCTLGMFTAKGDSPELAMTRCCAFVLSHYGIPRTEEDNHD